MGKTFLDWSDFTVQPHFWTRLFEALGHPGDFRDPKVDLEATFDNTFIDELAAENNNTNVDKTIHTEVNYGYVGEKELPDKIHANKVAADNSDDSYGIRRIDDIHVDIDMVERIDFRDIDDERDTSYTDESDELEHSADVPDRVHRENKRNQIFNQTVDNMESISQETL